MSQQIVEVVERLLARAPHWVRQDLLASDPITRKRAEEALAAMIGAALDTESAPPAAQLSTAAS